MQSSTRSCGMVLHSTRPQPLTFFGQYPPISASVGSCAHSAAYSASPFGPRPITSLSPAPPAPAAGSFEMSAAANSSLLISIHGFCDGLGGGVMVGLDG